MAAGGFNAVTGGATMNDLRARYAGRRVLVTGHTGFKGGWLTAWLSRLGAEVYGMSLAPDQGPDNLFDAAGIGSLCTSVLTDIRHADEVEAVFRRVRPEIVMHLAARALVQHGYEDPAGTFAVNVMGTSHVLEAARKCSDTRAVVCVTTDKVYLNKEWPWPYREEDELGGLDPYGASKAAAELVARAYQNALRPLDRRFALATARDGNVIGGGDWSRNRLVPDIVRAIRAGVPLTIRHPGAVRPWQHVIDLCYGYLMLGGVLIQDDDAETGHGAWNFGPSPDDDLTVSELVDAFLAARDAKHHPVTCAAASVYEAMVLRLDASKANRLLGWRPGLTGREAVVWSADWYAAYVARPADARSLIDNQLASFETLIDQRSSI